MTSIGLRRKVHDYVDQVDEKVLKMIYAMLKVSVEQNQASLLDSDQQKEIKTRLKRYQAGDEPGYTVEEAKQELYRRRKKSGKKK